MVMLYNAIYINFKYTHTLWCAWGFPKPPANWPHSARSYQRDAINVLD